MAPLPTLTGIFCSSTLDPSLLELPPRHAVRLGAPPGVYVEVGLTSRVWPGEDCPMPDGEDGLHVRVVGPLQAAPGVAVWSPSLGWCNAGTRGPAFPLGRGPIGLSPVRGDPWAFFAALVFPDGPPPAVVPALLESWLSRPDELLTALSVMES